MSNAAQKEAAFDGHFLKNTPECFLLLDLSKRITLITEVAEKILGFTPPITLGQNLLENETFMPRGALAELFSSAESSQRTVSREIFIEGPVSSRWYEIRIYPHPDGYILHFIDLSDRKKREAHLELLSWMVEQSSEGIAATDLNGNVLFANKSFATLFGLTPSELVGINVSAFHSMEQMEKVRRIFDLVFQRGSFEGEVGHQRLDGSEFPTWMSITLIRDNRGRPFGLVGSVRDITKLKKTEEALKHSEAEATQKRISLEQKTLDLRDLLEQIEFEKKHLQEKVLQNIQKLVLPSLKKLKLQKSDEKALSLIHKNLESAASSLGLKLSCGQTQLSPREIEIANLVAHGLSSKEIASSLAISPLTVIKHRKKIREKLAIKNKKINLTSFLSIG